MDARLIVLKLFLDQLGVSNEIGTLDDRKRVQKSVYLGQLSGVDLGYRFGWYSMGPYCPDLSNDYHSLAEAEASGDKGCEKKELKKTVCEKLKKVKPLLDMPKGLGLQEEQWLELLASVHFTERVRKLSPKKTRDTLKECKPQLVPFMLKAEQQLKSHGFLS